MFNIKLILLWRLLLLKKPQNNISIHTTSFPHYDTATFNYQEKSIHIELSCKICNLILFNMDSDYENELDMIFFNCFYYNKKFG